MDIGNAYRATDSFVLAMSFDGTVPVTGYVFAGNQYNRDAAKGMDAATMAKYSNIRPLKLAASLNEVLESAGDKIWQDKANNLVWIRHQGGLTLPQQVPNSDADLYRMYSIKLYAAAPQ